MLGRCVMVVPLLAVVLFTLLAGGVIAGALGLLVAVPIAATFVLEHGKYIMNCYLSAVHDV